MKTFVLFFLVAFLTLGCSNAKDSNSKATDTPAANASVADANGVGPLDGTWRETDILCNGVSTMESGPADLKTYLTNALNSPNSVVIAFRSDTVSQINSLNECAVTNYGKITYYANSYVTEPSIPVSCAPAKCNPGCGTTPTQTTLLNYELNETKDTLLLLVKDVPGCAAPQKVKFLRAGAPPP